MLAQGECMKRALPIVVLLVALAAGGVTFSAASARAAAPPPSVTIVLAPYLTWSDVTPETTPVLWRLAGSGAVGNVGARIRVQEPGDPPSPLEGALTMSAGNWAIPDYSAPSAFNATETVGSLTAADAYQRQTGRPMTPSAIAYLGLPGATRLNASTTAGTVLGTLGSAVRTGGGLTAAVGNSDSGAHELQVGFGRPWRCLA
jgi:hypothetical protein